MATLMRDCMINLPHYRKSLSGVSPSFWELWDTIYGRLCVLCISEYHGEKSLQLLLTQKRVPFCNNFRKVTISIPRKNTSANPLCIIGLKPKIKKIKLNFKFWRCYKFGNHKNSLILQLSSQWLVGNGWFYLELIREIPRSKSAFPF